MLLFIVGAGVVYKTTLMPETVSKRFQFNFDGQPVSGSGVWELDARSNLRWLVTIPPISGSLKGEAIPIPVSPDRVLFVLRNAQFDREGRLGGGVYLLQCVNPPHGSGKDWIKQIRNYSGSCEVYGHPQVALWTSSGTSGVESRDTYPPMTLPDGGHLVRLRSSAARDMIITVTTTDQPVSTGLSKIYPWINELQVLSTAHGDIGGRLFLYDFIRER